MIHTRLQNQVVSKCSYYHIQFKKDASGVFSLSYWIDWQQLREDERFDGIYLLRTNGPKVLR